MAKRSGTQKRQRHHRMSVCFNDEEFTEVQAMAERSAISVAALIRHALFNTPPPRAARKPTADLKAIARLLTELGKIGGNINQLAKHANAGRFQSDSIELAMRAMLECRTAILQAVGKEPYPAPDTDGE